jgi:peptidoglycan/xylan/chitin deacetylase (PgdA/CDA1 family)
MKWLTLLSKSLPVLVLVAITSPLLSQAAPQREVALTFDDLPAASANSMTGSEIVDMTTKLVTTLRAQKVPAVGFVNERKLYKFGEVDDRIKALSLWLDNGFELGNHTFSHASLNKVGLKQWEEEIVRGETVTRLLLAQHNMPLRFFRHPYLDAGLDVETRRQAEAFLANRGYQVAPVTMDAWDWMYAGVYEDARRRGDTGLQQQLVSSYLSYTNTVFDYYEKLSKELLGYEPKQVLLMHGNWLEADHVAEVLDVLRKRGYKFITLQDALSDPAYGMPDLYVGEGTNWIDHWAITRGHPPQNTPVFPQWVIDRSTALPHRPTQP